MKPLPCGPFTTIVADPPWPMRRDTTATLRRPLRAGNPTWRYARMTIQEICAVPVKAICGTDAHLYLWAATSTLEEAFVVTRAWGFEPKTVLTWVKPGLGVGFYFRTNTEHVIFAVRGALRTLRRDCPTAFQATRGRHSEKPDAFFSLVLSQSPGPYLELFARRRHYGFAAWGEELE